MASAINIYSHFYILWLLFKSASNTSIPCMWTISAEPVASSPPPPIPITFWFLQEIKIFNKFSFILFFIVMWCCPRTWGWCVILWHVHQQMACSSKWSIQGILTYRSLFQTQNFSRSGARLAGEEERRGRRWSGNFHFRLATALDQFLYTITAAVYWGSLYKLFYIKCLWTLAFAAQLNYWRLNTNTLIGATNLFLGHLYTWLRYIVSP